MTPVGSAQIDTAQSKFGGASSLFGGSGDYVSTTASPDFAFGTADFCLDAWVRVSSFGVYHIIMGCGYSTNWMWQLQTDGNLKLWVAGGSGLTFIHGMTTDAWHHICAARLGGVIYGYIDGVYKASNSYASSIGGSLSLYVGNDPQVSGAYAGHIDELRISKGTSRIGDVDDPLYCGGDPTNGFTPPTLAYAPVRFSSFIARSAVYTPQEVAFVARNIAYEPTKYFASFPARNTAIQGKLASFIARNNADVPQYSTFAARNEARVIRTASFATRNDINTFVNSSFPVRQMAMYAPGWNMYITDKSTDVTTFIGFIDAEAAHVLSDVSIAPGTYKLDARPIQHLWEDTTSAIRVPLTIKSATPTTPVAGVPDIINLTGTNSAGWTRLTWGVSAQPTGSNPRFGVWRGSTPVVLTGAAESVIYYDEQVQTYVLNVRQTASTYFAVLCVAGDVIGTATEVLVTVAASTLAKPTGVFAK